VFQGERSVQGNASGEDHLSWASTQGWADIIDFLTMYPDARRQIVRLLADVQAGGG
jgi:hypothetical protein